MVPLLCLLFAGTLAAMPFEAWKGLYNKQYVSVHEEAFRRTVFDSNMRTAAALNRANGAVFGAGPLADVTPEEFYRTYACLKGNSTTPQQPARVSSHLPEQSDIDWVKAGAVTSVKDQGAFGTCWAFGATAVVEGQRVIGKQGALEDLSPQELIDCASQCDGRSPDCAWTWMMKVGGQATQSSYGPYKGNAEKCHNQSVVIGGRLRGYDNVHSEDATLKALVGGPVNIGIDASDVQHYKSGIMTQCGCGGRNHAVVIVATGTENGVAYWKIKNSWGHGFGEQGYFRVQRGKGLCCLGQDTWVAHSI